MDPKDNAPSGSQSQTSVQSSVRLKVDKTWDHVTQHIEGNGKKAFICNFCHKIIRGGGINRVKKHLAGRKGELNSSVLNLPRGVMFISDDEKNNWLERQATKDGGISFIKSVDASSIESNAENLCNLFSEIVEMVGVKNVVQMVTDNGANYKVAGILLSKRYRTVTWSPCATHCLNLVLKDVSELDNVFSDLDEKHYSGDELTDLNKAIGMFRDSKGNFGRISAVQGRTKHRPDEWWRMFGGDCPILQNFAIRILSQTASSSGCERNWSVFERIHTKRRNRLEHQRLNDLVYVHYNLRLQHRLHFDKRSYDPVDYECIDETDFWVVEEEAQGELDYDQLENMVEQEPSSQMQGLVDEDDDDSEFHLLSDRELDAYNTPRSTSNNIVGVVLMFLLWYSLLKL
ncbi:hypothetical protein Tco_0657748 [Tanacetum coccineum]